jgi:hypothetical protein
MVESIELRQIVQALTDLIWMREQRLQRSIEATVLRFVQGAVTVELEYRRNMRDLNVLLAELEIQAENASSQSAGNGL